MGGAAFASQGLHTPRMSPELYESLKTKYNSVLKTLYRHVVTPAEAPGKLSHGDLDFLVAEPLPKNSINGNGNIPVANKVEEYTTVADVKAAFKTEYAVGLSAATMSYAVLLSQDEAQNGEDGKDVYAQIDVHLCPTAENMNWVAFKHSYGDLWSLLGMIGRAKGLVADEKSLNVRVEEIEDHNRELSKVELTRNIDETLEFFGLDKEKWNNGFENLEEVYAFITGSRFFEERYFREKSWTNASDRAKLGKRQMMRDFFGYLGIDIEKEEKNDEKGGEKEEEKAEKEEDVDTAMDEGRLSREDVLNEALSRFGKREAYEEKLRSWRRSVRIDMIIRGVVKGLVDGGHNSPKSARTKGTRLRKQINEGQMEGIFTMDEEALEVFIKERVEEIVLRQQGQPETSGAEIKILNEEAAGPSHEN